jgi:hypothetical protein
MAKEIVDPVELEIVRLFQSCSESDIEFAYDLAVEHIGDLEEISFQMELAKEWHWTNLFERKVNVGSDSEKAYSKLANLIKENRKKMVELNVPQDRRVYDSRGNFVGIKPEGSDYVKYIM